MQTSENIRIQPASYSGAWLVGESEKKVPADGKKKQTSDTKLRLRDWLLLIPDYDGSPSELERFVDSVRYAAAKWISDERTLLLALAAKLRGRASELIGYKIHRYASVEEFLASLCSYFAIGEAELFGQLHVARQRRGESVSEFGARVDKLASQLCVGYAASEQQRKIVEDLALASFRRGLRSVELEVCVGGGEPRSLEEAVSVAIAFDNQLSYRDKRLASRSLRCDAKRRYRFV